MCVCVYVCVSYIILYVIYIYICVYYVYIYGLYIKLFCNLINVPMCLNRYMDNKFA